MRYCLIDTETGGLTTAYDLLSVYIAVLDGNLDILQEYERNISPRSGHYKVTTEALAVNGINLVEHAKSAEAALAVIDDIALMLGAHRIGKDKFIPIGYNVAFDLMFLQEHLGSLRYKYLDYHTLDVASVVQLAILQGRIDGVRLGKPSLEAVAKALDIKPIGQLHTPKVDALLTLDVLKRLL